MTKQKFLLLGLAFWLSVLSTGCGEKPAQAPYKRLQVDPLSSEELSDPKKLEARKAKEQASAPESPASKAKAGDYKRLDLKPLTAAEMGLARQPDKDKP